MDRIQGHVHSHRCQLTTLWCRKANASTGSFVRWSSFSYKEDFSYFPATSSSSQGSSWVDGLVTAATLRTASSIFDRPIAKLILLPILDHDVSADMPRRAKFSGTHVEIKPSREKAPWVAEFSRSLRSSFSVSSYFRCSFRAQRLKSQLFCVSYPTSTLYSIVIVLVSLHWHFCEATSCSVS